MAHDVSASPALDRIVWALALLSIVTAAWSSDPDELFFKGTADVNEGELNFLTAPPDRPVHHHHNRITILDSSLVDGWVRLDQCHEHLDPVPDAQISYREGRIRNLQLTRVKNIETAWAETHSVQLRNVQRGAEVCVVAETLALSRNGEASYSLNNGPYMRRFLDGYYPMRVSMTVKLDTPKLRFVESIPADQPGFRIRQQGNEIGYDTVFEGILTTELRFQRVQP
jgi:hypothetical protein